MREKLETSIYICNQLIGLLEKDYQELHKNLQGELYDEYKKLMLEEIERVERLKKSLKISIGKY